MPRPLRAEYTDALYFISAKEDSILKKISLGIEK